MTAVGVPAARLLLDGLQSMGLSVVFGFVYHLLRLLLPLRSRVFSYFLHTLLFAAFGLLYFCFVLGQTAAQALRWHMLAGLAAGAAIYAVTMAPLVDAAARRLGALVRALLRPLAALLGGLRVRAGARLQKLYGLLYNALRKRRGPKPPRGDDDGKTAKRPIQIYTQT